MKIFHFYVLIVLIFGISHSVKSQADCRYGLKFFVQDEAGKTIENAKLELVNLDSRLKLPSYVRLIRIDDAYLFTSKSGTTVNGDFQLNISADGFEIYQQKVNFPICKIQNFDIKLKPLTNEKNTSILRGTVYDQLGEVIQSAKIIIIDRNGKRFETLTNENGAYEIKLPFTVYKENYDIRTSPITKYSIKVESRGFRIAEIKEFNFTQSKSGKMELDFALEVGLIGTGKFLQTK
jgi:hypothetical protein